MSDLLKQLDTVLPVVPEESSGAQPAVERTPATQQSAPASSAATASPTELPQPDDPDYSNMLYVVRERVYPMMSVEQVLRTSFQLDSNVFKYKADGTPEATPLFDNRKRLITNQSFKDVNELSEYMVKWGKIPSFLELRETPEKGIGVFTKVAIPKLTFLGFYQGLYRPLEFISDGSYNFNTKDFSGHSSAYIDAGNLTFSNWTRFMNDAESTNVEASEYNHQVFMFTIRDVAEGEELTTSYGKSYWDVQAKKGVTFVK